MPSGPQSTWGVIDFSLGIVVREPRRVRSDSGLLGYLEALTYDFDHGGQEISCVLTYAQPHPDRSGCYQAVIAADTGYEGIACVDDTARAALLALQIYRRSGSRKALALARRWLTFVEYMQYPDGQFANFIRNSAGIRNATGPTSVKGGYAWTMRALWALAAAYRISRDPAYLERYELCKFAPTSDTRVNAVLALAEMELYQAEPSEDLRRSILNRCRTIVGEEEQPYFTVEPGMLHVQLWGYHQLHAVASAAALLDEPSLLASCRRTIANLIEPDVRAMFWHSYPDRRKDHLCAYMVSPIVQGLDAMHHATGARRYRDLALRGAAWFYGRNDARAPMYDPTTGMCRDGMTDGVVSDNYGAESSIEAGFAELVRRDLDPAP